MVEAGRVAGNCSNVLAIILVCGYGLAVLAGFRTEDVRRALEDCLQKGHGWVTNGVPACGWTGGMSASVRDTVQ